MSGVGAVQRQREIVGAAGLSDSVQQRIFGDRAVEPASERGPRSIVARIGLSRYSSVSSEPCRMR